MTVLVGQALRPYAEKVLREARIPITRQGYSDSSTTTWAFIVRTRRHAQDIQNLMWNSGIAWCSVQTENFKGVGRNW